MASLLFLTENYAILFLIQGKQCTSEDIDHFRRLHLPHRNYGYHFSFGAQLDIIYHRHYSLLYDRE